MKATSVVFSILAALGSIAAVAQNLPHFQHVVLVIQENRTPDNLFGASPSTAHCGVSYPFEAGVDIQDGGPDYFRNGADRCLMAQHLDTCWDVGHFHTHWNTQADIDTNANPPQAKMDKACQTQIYPESPGCLPPTDCPQYSFVQQSDVQPYFDIATNYGFANYMFQTNEGPSYPAHQFLLGGTSAPTYPLDANNYYQYFVSENGYASCDTGAAGAGTDWADFTGADISPLYDFKDCFDHATLVDLLDTHGVTWRYYSPKPGSIWTAVNSILHLCYSDLNIHQGQPCNTYDWVHNMVFAPITNSSVPVITDIQTCQLQGVSWVIPDGRWSDHAGQNLGLGPSYVADIVDAIGQSGCTDTLGTQSYTYWQDTAIFILWDDWGGWYDHVPPPPNMLLRQFHGPQDCNPSQKWGCGYTYGFRVPLLVVSAYTPAGYVSGSIAHGGPGMNPPYIHDFGSILRFIENNFGLGYINSSGAPGYADFNAPDNVPPSFLPLADFFPGPYRNFTYIQPAAGLGPDYFTGYFNNPQNQGQTPEGPDGDDAD